MTELSNDGKIEQIKTMYVEEIEKEKKASLKKYSK